MRPTLSDLTAYPVNRLEDNQYRGLLQELAEALEQEDNPRVLEMLHGSLKMLANFAQSQAFTLRTSDQ
jgi:hypothetical protein